MMVGDKNNPIAFGRKSELLDNLDEEFYLLLKDAGSHFVGFKKISDDDINLPEAYIEATKYLVFKLIEEYRTNVGF